MALDPRLAAIVFRYAPRLGLDPRAALAVAMNESGGRFGAVGDNGTSFGPWQLHVGGALPHGRNAAWANSLPGILYALRTMANSGARGLHGQAAVSAIARNFERPADPGAEIRTALGYYGNPGFARNQGGGGDGQVGRTATSYRTGGAPQAGSNIAGRLAALQLLGQSQAPGIGALNLPTEQGTLQSLMQANAPLQAQQAPLLAQPSVPNYGAQLAGGRSSSA